ncbi:hypothetical protein AcW1_005207 [Taiwanofungus camphoratus]|nr:hypothetical protein AcW2_003977 [Antrodia cinnamomea]KAI0956556.1 hypothetical protein AcW1_005207 [Antrodia cinnamomea]
MVRTTRGTSSDSQEVEEEDDESIYRRRNIGRQGNARPEAGEADLFMLEGRPAFFHMYTAGLGKLSPDQVKVLTDKIMGRGGTTCSEEEDADVILVNFIGVEMLEAKYWDSRTVWVEDPRFVQMCINTGKFEENFKKPLRKGMGGHVSGTRRRVPFTAEDDANLCEYLASVIPYEEEGGRSGIAIYKRLIKSAEYFKRRRWALRHTMWSWRERYRNNVKRMDPIIDQLVEENPPRADGKGLYERSRLLNPSMFGQQEEDDDETDEYDNWELNESQLEQVPEDLLAKPQKRKHSLRDDESERERRRRSSIQPAKRSRHTDQGPRRSSAVDHGRSMRRARSYSQPHRVLHRPSVLNESDTDPSWEISKDISEHAPFAEEDDYLESDFETGAKIAGSSGREQSPISLLSSPERHTSAKQARGKSKQTDSRLLRKNGTINAALSKHRSKVPMSSQATLVAPVPTQLRGDHTVPGEADDIFGGPTQVEEQYDENAPKVAGPSQPRPNQVSPSARSRPVYMQKLREAGEGGGTSASRTSRVMTETQAKLTAARRRRNKVAEGLPSLGARKVAPNPDRFFEERLSKDKGKRKANEVQVMAYDEAYQEQLLEERQGLMAADTLNTQSGIDPQLLVGGTYEEEDAVEQQLMRSKSPSRSDIASAASNGRQKNPYGELDSDDERVHQNLLPSVRSFASNSNSAISDAKFVTLSSSKQQERDDDGPQAPSFSGSATRMPGAQRYPQTPAVHSPRRSSATRPNPLTPLGASDLRRRATMGSTTSDPDTVPMPGTRASEKKKQATEEQKQTPYTPPAGTRAAATLSLRSRVVPRIDRTGRR